MRLILLPKTDFIALLLFKRLFLNTQFLPLSSRIPRDIFVCFIFWLYFALLTLLAPPGRKKQGKAGKRIKRRKKEEKGGGRHLTPAMNHHPKKGTTDNKRCALLIFTFFFPISRSLQFQCLITSRATVYREGRDREGETKIWKKFRLLLFDCVRRVSFGSLKRVRLSMSFEDTIIALDDQQTLRSYLHHVLLSNFEPTNNYR